MQQTGREPPEKTDGKKSGEKSFQSVLEKGGLASSAPQHFYYSRNAHLKENCPDHLGQKDVTNKYWLVRSSAWLSNVHVQLRKPTEREDSAPLPCSLETPSGALHPTLEPPTQKEHGSVGTSPEKSQKDAPRASLLWRHTERLGVA